MSYHPSIAEVSCFANRGEKSYRLTTEQAEAIQHDSLLRIVDDVEVYVAGGRVQATYDWHGKGEWQLSDGFIKRYVFDPRVAEIEREINSGLYYLAGPEETVFKLACGLIIKYDIHDAYPYVIHGPKGGEIDRWDKVSELAEGVVDHLLETDQKCACLTK
jgi:hypothetical protein